MARGWKWMAAGGWTAAALLAGILIGGALGARPVQSTRSWQERPGSYAPVPAAPTARVNLAGIETAEQFVSRVGEGLGLPAHAAWERMELRPQEGVRFDLPSADLETAFRLLNAQRDGFICKLDYRVFADHVEIGSVEYFDRQETTTVNYNVGELVRRVIAADPITPAPTQEHVVSVLTDVIESNVDAQHWVANGGDLARINPIGSGLLITAPDRMHAQVRWLLDEFDRTPGWSSGLHKLLRPATGPGGGGPASGTSGGPPPMPALPGGGTAPVGEINTEPVRFSKPSARAPWHLPSPRSPGGTITEPI